MRAYASTPSISALPKPLPLSACDTTTDSTKRLMQPSTRERRAWPSSVSGVPEAAGCWRSSSRQTGKDGQDWRREWTRAPWLRLHCAFRSCAQVSTNSHRS